MDWGLHDHLSEVLKRLPSSPCFVWDIELVSRKFHRISESLCFYSGLFTAAASDPSLLGFLSFHLLFNDF